MRLHYTSMGHWPRLAWLARARRSSATIEVFHGPEVETTARWFCEAVWDGAFAAGDFDRTDVVFGSGGRLRGRSVSFVSSATTVDRLHSFETVDAIWVSNSLACLLAALGEALDPRYHAYARDFHSICRGLTQYARFFPTASAGPVRLTYYHNLVWDGARLREQAKPGTLRDFSAFARYRAFLASSLERLADNMASPARSRPYRLLGTISSGYDSPTVATLARPFGLEEAIGFDRANSGEADSGSLIAAALGIRLLPVRRHAWRSMELPEVPFVASDAKGEDVYFKGAEPLLARRLLLTGFHGDQVWSKGPKSLSDDIRRGDQSGLSLTEYRLGIGFLHCPVPFIGVRQIADINRISRSREMAPWDVGNGYSRPICRRILEEAGIPRGAFGVRKKAVSVLYHQGERLSPRSLADFRAWMHKGFALLDPGSVVPRLWTAPARSLSRLLKGIARLSPRHLRPLQSLGARVATYVSWEPRRYLFAWALDRARGSYGERSAVSGKRLVVPLTAYSSPLTLPPLTASDRLLPPYRARARL